jgi:tetratricopeptide (TPR) repeat protein
MSNNYTNSDLLVQYLDGELSPEEKLKVENELKINTALQRELENLSFAKNAVKTYGLKQKVGAIHEEMMQEMAIGKPSQTSTIRRIVRIGMRIAASVLVALLGVGIYQYTTTTPDKLFHETYQPYSLSVSRGAAEANMMEKAYREKNYNTVIEQFTNLQNADQKENFLAGQAFLATNNYTKAIACFNKVLNLNFAAKTSIFKDDAEYYIALSYLKNKQVSDAYPFLINIRNNPQHMYNDKITSSVMRQLKLLDWKY